MVAHKDFETAHDNFGESIVESRQQISLSVTTPPSLVSFAENPLSTPKRRLLLLSRMPHREA